MASLRSNGEARVLDLPKAITKHVMIVRESEGVWGEKAEKARPLSNEIPPGAKESRREVTASIVAAKRVTIGEPREAGR
jgi:hypothetical protein